VTRLQDKLEEWSRQCPLCHLRGVKNINHQLVDCLAPGADGVRQEWAAIQARIRYEKYSGCFFCGVPQAICQRWRPKDGGGYARCQANGETTKCQFPDVLIPTIEAIMGEGEESIKKLTFAWMREEGVDTKNYQQVLNWMGKKIRWGGMETNQMVKVFYRLTCMLSQ